MSSATDDQPWPIHDVLVRLADDADHLLKGHNCDCLGHEETAHARDAARRHAAALATPREVLAPDLASGDHVRMSAECKAKMIANGSAEHVAEFGECEGVVFCLLDYGTTKGPEVDVRWLPSGLRYGYHPDDLVKIAR